MTLQRLAANDLPLPCLGLPGARAAKCMEPVCKLPQPVHHRRLRWQGCEARCVCLASLLLLVPCHLIPRERCFSSPLPRATMRRACEHFVFWPWPGRGWNHLSHLPGRAPPHRPSTARIVVLAGRFSPATGASTKRRSSWWGEGCTLFVPFRHFLLVPFCFVPFVYFATMISCVSFWS